MTDSALLLDKYFETAFDSPEGIEKLKELILTLAMKGKLVPQDPKDPPASELLKQIVEEKVRGEEEGGTRRRKGTKGALPAIDPAEVPYELPEGWEWVRLGDVGSINPRNSIPDEAEIGFVSMSMIEDGYSNKHSYEIRKWKDVKTGFTHFAENDVGLAKITPCFENRKSCVFRNLPNGQGAGTTELHIFRNSYAVVECTFLLMFLKSPIYLNNAISKMTGSAGQKRVPTDFFSTFYFPLPPLPEQKRIVAKIEELMARVEELARMRSAREEKRVAAHRAGVAGLWSSETFAQSWGFLARHFEELHRVPETVAELRKAVLQLGVMGKLVPQDPKDPPASELLKEIAAERARLVKEGKTKAPKPLPPINPEEVPFEVPKGWEWVRLGEVCSKITDGEHQTPPRLSLGKRLVSAKNVRDGFLNLNDCDYISDQDYEKARMRCLPETGDLLIVSVGGTIGRTSLVFEDSNFALVRSVALIKPLKINSSYLRNCFESSLIQNTINDRKRGAAQPCLYLSEIENFEFPLPPINVQQRIVSLVEKLMKDCDELERAIGDSSLKRGELLNAVVGGV